MAVCNKEKKTLSGIFFLSQGAEHVYLSCDKILVQALHEVWERKKYPSVYIIMHGRKTKVTFRACISLYGFCRQAIHIKHGNLEI